LRVRYVAGRSGAFRIAGEPMADGADLRAVRPMTIEIEGLGEIDIIPAAHDEGHDLAQGLAAAEETIGRLLGEMGASDITDAERREDRRLELLRMRDILTAERQAMAPGDLDEIDAHVRILEAAISDDGAATPSPEAAASSLDELQAELDQARVDHAGLLRRLDLLKSEKSSLEQRRVGIAVELRIRRSRRDELLSMLQAEGAEVRRSELADDVATAEADLNAAVRERIALQEIAMSDDGLEALKGKIADGERRAAERARRLGEVREEKQRIGGMLARDFEDDALDAAPELSGRLVELQDRKQDLEQHIAALKLLAQELTDETARRRREISKPLSSRLSALASRVWPAAEIGVEADLSVGRLIRQGRPEVPEAVSSGTREQVAILSRLAYAGMLAGSGEAAPLILDDPLVFSDDARLERLFDVIADAAKWHQVIILTCHERAFAPLISDYGATRLAVRALETA